MPRTSRLDVPGLLPTKTRVRLRAGARARRYTKKTRVRPPLFTDH